MWDKTEMFLATYRFELASRWQQLHQKEPSGARLFPSSRPSCTSEKKIMRNSVIALKRNRIKEEIQVILSTQLTLWKNKTESIEIQYKISVSLQWFISPFRFKLRATALSNSVDRNIILVWCDVWGQVLTLPRRTANCVLLYIRLILFQTPCLLRRRNKIHCFELVSFVQALALVFKFGLNI